MDTNRFNQTVSDGLFHLFVTIIILIVAILLWKSDGVFLGAEWIINHHLLQIHHVKPGPNGWIFDLLYDFRDRSHSDRIFIETTSKNETTC